MYHCPYLPFGMEPVTTSTQPNCPRRKHRKMYRNRPITPYAYDRKRSKPSKDNYSYMNELLKLKYVGKYDPEKSPPHRASPLVLLDDKKDKVTITDDKFLIRLNTDGYSPQELSVKHTDKFIFIEGLHEMMSPYSQVTRSFSKKYSIPDSTQVDDIFFFVNSNTGDLLVEAPRLSLEETMIQKLKPMKLNDGESPKVHFKIDLAEEAKENNNNTTLPTRN